MQHEHLPNHWNTCVVVQESVSFHYSKIFGVIKRHTAKVGTLLPKLLFYVCSMQSEWSH